MDWRNTSKTLLWVRFGIIFWILTATLFSLVVIFIYFQLISFHLFVIVSSSTCFVRSSPNNYSVGSLFAEHKDLNSGFKEDFISSRLFNERSCDIFPATAIIFAAICAIICISDIFFRASAKIQKSFSVKYIALIFFLVKQIFLSSILNMKNAKHLKKDKWRITAHSVVS